MDVFALVSWAWGGGGDIRFQFSFSFGISVVTGMDIYISMPGWSINQHIFLSL